MKPELTYQKLRGGYYTPRPIADFLARWAIQSPTTEVLEPSCGDGMLIESAVKTLSERGAESTAIAKLIHGIEIDPQEAEKAAKRLRALNIPSLPNQIYTGDFFAYCKANLFQERFFNVIISEGRCFDAIIGNPPFIRYQNFPEEYRSVAFDLMQQAGLHPNRLTNSWVPFLVASTFLLKEQGRVAMVIPAELFQVNYAAEIRQFLSDFYRKITLITFKSLVFKGIQQEIILFLGERNGSESQGIRVIELEGIEDLALYKHTDFLASELKPLDHSIEKWTQYFLNKEEIILLRSLRTNPKLTLSGNVIDVDVGVVTGQNEFFILTQEQVKQYLLEPHLERIVSRSAHLQGAVFSGLDWTTNVQKQFPTLLFSPPDLSLEQLPPPTQDYIIYGEEKGFNKGFKCRIRKRWYVVPSVWVPDAFMLRQVHGYPKLVLNRANATCTDTIHRVRLLNSTNGETITAAFLNSLTFAFAEITGRSYGGGVLTFEPSEAERLPLPLVGSEALNLQQLDKLLRANDIEAVLDITDKILLIDNLGLSIKETKMLRDIWHKLRDRRINRRHNSDRVE